MGRALGDATARLRFTIPRIAPAGLAILAPWLLFTTVDASAPLSLVFVTLALVALVRLGAHGAVLVARTTATRPPARGQAPPLLTGRITDPTRHPLRPRAPGMA